MKLWTTLAAVVLLSAHAFSQSALEMPKSSTRKIISPPSSTPIAAIPHNPTHDSRITWSQGYLALVLSSAPNDTILSWDADTVECLDTVFSAYFHPMNFGTEDITICAPVEPESQAFSRFTDCVCYNTLAAGTMSPCSVLVEFHPGSDGTFLDTLRMQTNAWNSYGGFVRIPLSGTRRSTPASPTVVILISNMDARLFWDPVHLSVGGCAVNVPGYLVFYAPENNGVYRLLNFTADTTYTHYGVIAGDGGLFYQVIAGSQPADAMRRLPLGETMGNVLGMLK